jgi:hypothetical protein
MHLAKVRTQRLQATPIAAILNSRKAGNIIRNKLLNLLLTLSFPIPCLRSGRSGA